MEEEKGNMQKTPEQWNAGRWTGSYPFVADFLSPLEGRVELVHRLRTLGRFLLDTLLLLVSRPVLRLNVKVVIISDTLLFLDQVIQDVRMIPDL